MVVGCMNVECPLAVAEKTPDQNETCGDNLAKQIMCPYQINTYPHEESIQDKPNCGNDGKFNDGFPVSLVAAESIAVVHGIIDYRPEQGACRRSRHGINFQALYQSDQQAVVADG